MRSPFLLFKRSLTGGKKVYYAKFWNEKTKSYSLKRSIAGLKLEIGRKARNLSVTSKAGATAIVQMWLDNNDPTIGSDAIGKYLSEFWTEKSEYIKAKRRREEPISSAYLKNNSSGITLHVVPFLESINEANTPIQQVRPELFETLLAHLADNTALGNSRINSIYKSVTVPFSEAVRLGKLQESPAKTVKKLIEKKVKRDIMNPTEVKAFFEEIKNSPVHYGINILAATTGMRLGECRGLLHENVHDGWVDISTNWQEREAHGSRMKDPKWGSTRAVPLPVKTYEALQYLIENNPFGNNFVFYGSKVNLPVGKKTVEENFNKTVVSVGIKDEDRRERGITFHAWRHFYNSMLRGNIPDHALRELTGHKNEEMTDRYSRITDQQRTAVANLAEDLI